MKLEDINITELYLKEEADTKYFSTFSSLPFNRGVIFKKIGTQPSSIFEEILFKLKQDLPEKEIRPVKSRSYDNPQIHDFIFDILTHKDVREKWRYNDDGYFTEFSQKFDRKETFRELGIFEITKQEFIKSLAYVYNIGSCYSRIYNRDDVDIIAFNFCEKILSGANDRIFSVVHLWGEYFIGWFKCFFILRGNDIVIFAVDDYD